MKTLTVDECLELLKCEKTKFFSLVHQGAIPGAKIGRCWIFLEEDIHQFLKNEIEKQQQEILRIHGEKVIRYELLMDHLKPLRRKRSRGKY